MVCRSVFLKRVAWFVAGILLIAGCGSVYLDRARIAFYNNRPDAAADILSNAAEGIPAGDRLILYMEKGTVLHHAGDYPRSIHEFLKASRLMDSQDVISASQQTASMLINDWLTEYKGEYSERLWAHTYLMMNFLLLGRHESALVEAKQALKLFDKFPEALARDYFTRALIAHCFDSLNETNDAYIEYKKLWEQMGNLSPVAEDLYRLAQRLGLIDEAGQYKAYLDKTYSAGQETSEDTPKPSELVLFVGKGRGPIKYPGNIFLPPSIRFSFPQYRIRDFDGHGIRIVASGDRFRVISITTSINDIAGSSLKARAARIAAKEIARAAIKESIARAVEKKNDQLVGILVRGSLMIMEDPDTRCWETLPAFFTLVRIPLAPGKHHVTVIIEGGAGSLKKVDLPEISLENGQRIYRSIRVD